LFREDKVKQVNNAGLSHRSEAGSSSPFRTGKTGAFVRARRGFAIAPLLYILTLAGVAAGVLYGGYSQILRTNAQMTNNLTVKNDSNAAETTLAATSGVSSTDPTILCPPRSSADASGDCASAPLGMMLPSEVSAADIAANHVPNNLSAATSGTGEEIGFFQSNAGTKQLDPWGHFYVYCRWEASGGNRAIAIISAGPNGKIETPCGAAAPNGDDQIFYMTAATAINRASVWQQTATGTVQYGNPSSKVIIGEDGTIQATNLVLTGTGSILSATGTATLSNLSLSTPLPVTSGGTGASTAVLARQDLGSGIIGDELFTSTSSPTARAILGSGTVGDALFIAQTATDAMNAVGATTMGQYLLLSATTDTLNAALIRSILLASGTTGDALFTAPDQHTARADLGSTPVGEYLLTATIGDPVLSQSARETLLGAGAAGESVFVAGTASAARTALGSGAVGDALFQAPTQALAWQILGFTGTSYPTLDVSVSGSAASVPASGIQGIVQIEQGGTGANNVSDARHNLGTDYAGNITYGTLDVNLLADYSIPSTKLTTTGVAAGVYNWGAVDAEGRVTEAFDVTTGGVGDNNGDTIYATGTSNELYFETASNIQMVLTATGSLGLGTLTPEQKLQVNNGNILISGPAETNRQLMFATGTSASGERWTVGANSSPENNNAGSDFTISNYSDTGSLLGTPLTIYRQTGNALFSGQVTANGGFVGNLTGNVTGTVNGGITGTLGLNDGALGTPSLYFVNDTTMGLYRPSAGTMAFVYNNAETLRMTPTGSVGIGTTAPAHLLEVNGSAGAQMVHFTGTTTGPGDIGDDTATGAAGAVQYDDGTGNFGADPNAFVWDETDKRLGIGTNAPRVALDIVKTDGVILPVGSSSQRPSGVVGTIRYNNTTGAFEGYSGTGWGSLGSSTSTGSSTGSYLGASATAANPSRSDDFTTGFFSATPATVSLSISGVERMRATASGSFGFANNATPRGFMDLGYSTDSLILPTGSSIQRPTSPIVGMMRYNTSLGSFEGYTASGWGSLGSAVGSTGTGTSGQSMVSGWPDAIVCNVTSPNWGSTIFYPYIMPYSPNGKYWYEPMYSGASYQIGYNSDGSFYSYTNITASNCDNKSISTLISSGQAFNFVNSSGSMGAMSDGTAGAPGLYFTAEPVTGIYRPTSSAIAFATNSTEKLRITGTGSFGFGTITPRGFADMGFSTDSLILPTGSSTTRPISPIVGMMRYNTSLGAFEGYTASGWGSLGSAVGSTGTGLQGQSMVPGWPDAIVCTLTAPQSGVFILLGGLMPLSDGYHYYTSTYTDWGGAWGSIIMLFNNDGSFYNQGWAGALSGAITSNCNKAISALVAGGQAFNFVNSGGAMGAMSDGTAGAPGLYFTAEQKTGLYRPTASAIGFATNGTEKLRVTGTGSFGFNTITPQASVDMGSNTDALIIPTGTTSQRPATSVAGMIRYNTTLGSFEGYTASGWGSLGSAVGSTGTGAQGQSMFAGWPDAITCNITNAEFGTTGIVLYAYMMPYTPTGLYQYRALDGTGADNYPFVAFNSNGSFNSYNNITSSNCGVSISTLIANGQAFNFVNSGGAMGAMSDGTAGAPGLYFTAEQKTGLYRPTASAIGFATNGTEKLRVTGTGSFGFNTITPQASVDMGSNTDALIIPTGTTSQRPVTSVAGMIRYNTTLGSFEGYTASGWGAIGGTGTGGAGIISGYEQITNTCNDGPCYANCSTGKKVIGGGCWLNVTPEYLEEVPSGTGFECLTWGSTANNVNALAICAYATTATSNFGGTLGTTATSTSPSRSGDITTGLYSDTASTVEIATSGTERFRLSSNGLAAGTGNSTSAVNALALGQSNAATATGAVALGVQNASAAAYSAALGFGNATTVGGTATGNAVPVTSEAAFALGEDNKSYGQYAGALGYGNVVSGQYAMGLGTLNTISGQSGVALGQANTVTGNFGSALGYGNSVASSYGIALGENMTVSSGATNSMGIALGAAGYTLAQANTLAIMGGVVGIGTVTPAVSLDLGSKTDAARLPVGGSALRPTGAVGEIRYNSDLGAFEGYTASGWGSLGAGSTATSGTASFTAGSQIFTSSATFTPPTGISVSNPLEVRVLVVGGGATGTTGNGGGGGSSGYVAAQEIYLTSTANIAVTVGASDSSSSFGSYVTANNGTVASGGSGGAGGCANAVCTGYLGGSNGSAGPAPEYAGGTGQGSPIVSAANTVLGILFQSATFSAGSGGATSSGCAQYGDGGGAGGILVNGAGSSGKQGTVGEGGLGGIGYGAGGGAGCPWAGGVGGSGGSGVVYIEWGAGSTFSGSGSSGTASGAVNYLAKFTASSSVGDSIEYDTGTSIGVNTASPRGFMDLGASADSLILPTGSTTTRPASAIVGMMRYNTSLGAFEGYTASGWGSLGSAVGSTGTGAQGQSMVPGWPDVIKCNSTGEINFLYMDYTINGSVYYRLIFNNSNDAYIIYASNGTYSSSTAGMAGNDCVTNAYTISQLIANGQAFNLANSGGAAGSMSDGTAGAPGLYFTAEPTTGIYRPTASTIAFSTSGTEKLRVTGTGSVGIGTITPRGFMDLGASTDSLILPTGSTTTRPASAIVGMMRYNTTLGSFEGYTASGWGGLGSTGSGSSTLGSSTATTSPYRSGDVTTGLFSATACTVSIGISGTEVVRTTATGVNLPNLLQSYGIANNKVLTNPAGDPTSIAVGVLALQAQTSTGLSNTAVGQSALTNTNTGTWNTAVGLQALDLNTTGNSNTAVGVNALYTTSTGTWNTAIGASALYQNTNGNSNTAEGVNALYYNTTGVWNTANGVYALYKNTSGNYNVAEGVNALQSNSSGSGNTVIGSGAYNNTATTTGGWNTILGYQVGSQVLNAGTNNILIGTSSAVDVPTGAPATSNWINIGNTIYGNTASGQVALGSGVTSVKAGAVLDMSKATGAALSSIILPQDSTTNRPTTGVAGMIRYNTTTNAFEGYQGSTLAWSALGGGGSSTLGASTATTSPYRSGDPKTGLYSDTASTVEIATSGTERLRVTGTGSVGIGINAPSQQLEVNGNINVTALTNGYYLNDNAYLVQPAGDFSSLGVGEWSLSDQTATNQGNTAVGSFVLANYTGTQGGNTGLGSSSLNADTSGSYNTALGAWTLTSNVTGYENVAVGASALEETTTGYYNTAVGTWALQADTSGNQNTALGHSALSNNTSGGSNTAIGVGAMANNTSGGPNMALGAYALTTATNSQYNVAIGPWSLQNDTSGSWNTAIGVNALQNNQTGNFNTGIGLTALQNTTAGDNTAIGVSAMASNTSGSQNVAIGEGTLNMSGYTGSNNIAVGFNAGDNVLTTGSGNILIGNSVDVPTGAPATSNWINIGNTIYGNTASGSVALGSGVTSVKAGAVLDMSKATGSALSSIILPQDSTTNRPTTGVVGMMRYNTTLGAFEGYTASGWGSLGSAVGSTGTGAQGQSIYAGWPDVIVCNGSDGGARPFYFNASNSSTIYYIAYITGAYTYVAYNISTGAYSSTGNTAGLTFDCVTNAWSLSYLVANGKAFNLANGGGGTSAMSDGTAGAPGLYFTAETKTGLYRPTASTIGFATNGTEKLRVTGTGSVGVGIITPRGFMDLGASTDSLILPTGSSVQRPASPIVGMMRYNTDLGAFEGYTASGWGSLGSALGSTGTGSGQSMIPGWPDAIVCNLTSPNWGTVIFYADVMPYSDGTYYYRAVTNNGSNDFFIVFSSAGNFNLFSSTITTATCNKSISQLVAAGQTFNFVKGSGGSGTLGTTATATSPSRSGDLGTGLFSAVASAVSIATAGIEALRVTATQSVGIGTTTPAATVAINGDLLLGTASRTCDSNHLGLMQYTASGFQGCTTGGWVVFLASGCTHGTQTFAYTGSSQTFTVPTNCTSLTVKLWGAGGSSENNNPGGGGGGFITGSFAVTPGTTYAVIVGGAGSNATCGSAYGGGGEGGCNGYGNYGSGGGRSALGYSGVDIVTAGGGGGGCTTYSLGGAGGGANGGVGASSNGITGGGGGTQAAGGVGGTGGGTENGTAGSQYQGGTAGGLTIGGSGGGGWYGGGGGSWTTGVACTGGGGGSSYAGSLTGVTNLQASGTLPAGTSDPSYAAGVGVGNTSSQAAGNGLVIISY